VPWYHASASWLDPAHPGMQPYVNHTSTRCIAVCATLIWAIAMMDVRAAAEKHASDTVGPVIAMSARNDNTSAGITVGKLAPRFVLMDVHGTAYRYSPALGKSTTICFFCGCDLCRSAATVLATEQRRGKFRNAVLVVSLGRVATLQFQQETGLRGVMLTDPSEIVAPRYGAMLCPRIVQVGPDGRVRYLSPPSLKGASLIKAVMRVERTIRCSN
jgi:hypothetical protein